MSTRVVCATALGVTGLMVSAAPVHAQRTVATGTSSAEEQRAAEALFGRRVNVDLTQVTRRQAIDVISERSKVPVQYRAPLLDVYSDLISIHMTDAPLGIVLERVLQGTKLRVVPDDATHLIIVDAAAVVADSSERVGTITGVVTDSSSGRALEGAMAQVAGTKLRAATDARGRFTIRGVPVGDQVVSVKTFGYRVGSQSVTVTGGERSTTHFVLSTVPNIMAGVVTTATGVQDRRALGNDITVINVDSVMRTAPIHSVTDLLETRVPGLTVLHTSGVPGAPSRLRLRGVGGGLVAGAANTNNDPIVYVDGIRVYARQSTDRDRNGAATNYSTPSAIDQIDPNSIETIEVFKGPSASALYGSEAANGVIVITTKRGKAGPAHVSADVNYGVEYMPGVYAGVNPFVFAHSPSSGHVALCDMQIVLIGWCSQIDSVVRFQALDNDRLSAFGIGNTTEGSATISGGNQSLLYSLTGSARGTLGYLKMPDLYRDAYTSLYNKAPDDWMKRPNLYRTWSGTGTITSIPRQGLRLSLTSSLSKNAQRQGSAQDQLSVLATSYIDTLSLGTGSLEGYTTRVMSNGVTFTNGATADWSATERIAVNARAGISTTERDDESYRPFGIIALGGLDTVGKFRMGHGSAESHTMAANVVYTPISMIKTTAGLEFHRETTHDFLATADSLAPGITRPLNFNSASQQSNSLTTAGWFVEPRLNLNSRFFASPGFRFDGGSAAGAHGGVNGGLFSLFPRLDFSWIAVDREGEAPLGGIVSLFRPRVAFGVAGVQPDPTWKLRLSSLPTLNNALQSSGLFLTSLGNVNLRPERSREFEGGFDMQLWGNRLALKTSYYNKLRIDAITSIEVAPSIYGGSSTLPFYVNVGRIRNTGVELSADATIIETSAISWQLSAQYSSDKNRLLTFNGDPNLFGEIANGDIRFVPGYPVNGRWVRPIVGYNTPAPGQALSIGDVALGDSSVYVGQESPKFQLPVSTALTLWHGKVRLNATFDFQDGMTQLNQGGTLALAKFALSTTATPGQQAAALAAACYYASTTAPGCDAIATAYGLIQTVSVLRFNSLSIGYQVPRTISQRLRVPQMNIALQGSNLGLWTNYRGKDPNVSAVTSSESVIDTGILPLPRTWRLSVNFGN